MLDVVTPLMQTLQAQATLEHTQATTQDVRALGQMRMLSVALQQQQMQRDAAMRNMLMQRNYDPFVNQTGPASGAPVAGQGGLNPPAQNPNTTLENQYGVTGPLIDSLRNAQQSVNDTNFQMQMAQVSGDVKMYDEAVKRKADMQKEYRLAQVDVMKEGERRFKEAAQTFGSVTTPEELRSAMQYVNDTMPKMQAKQIISQIAKQLPDIDNATPEQITAAVDPIRNRFATMGEQYRYLGTQQASQDRANKLAETTAHNQKLEAAADERAARERQGIGEPMTGDALELAAQRYLYNGSLPSLYRDPESKKAIIARAAEIQKEAGGTLADVPSQQAAIKSSQTALTSITKDLAAIRPYKEMLDTNADILKDLSKNVIKTNVTYANKSLNWLTKNAAGDADTAEYLAQMRIVQTEAARVLNNPRLVGQLTDTARKEMEHVLDGDMSLDQTTRVIDRLKQDGQNRVDAMERERETLMKGIRSGGRVAPSGQAVAPTNAPAQTAPQSAIDYLRAHPELKEQFRTKYGYLPQ